MMNPMTLVNVLNSTLQEAQNIKKTNNIKNIIPLRQNNNPYLMELGGPLIKFLNKGYLELGGDPTKPFSVKPNTNLITSNSTYVNKPELLITDNDIYGSLDTKLTEYGKERYLNNVAQDLRAFPGGRGGDPHSKASNKLYEKELGGKIGFKQFEGNTHSEGGINIDQNGNITNNSPSANVENNENIYRYSMLPDKKSDSYVFSDVNNTSNLVKEIVSKYKNKNTNTDFLSRGAMEQEIKKVENLNEKINLLRNQVNNTLDAKYGKKMELGGPFDPVNINPQQIDTYDADFNYGVDSTGSLDIFEFNQKTNPYNIKQEVVQPRSLYQPLNLPHNTPLTVSPNTTDSSLEFGETALVKSNEDLIGPYGKAGMFLQGLGLLGSAAQAFQPPHRDRLILPDTNQSDSRFNRMSANLTNAVNQVLGQNNVVKQQIDDSSLSDSVRSARLMQLNANTQNALSNIAAQEQSLRNNIAQTQGQYEYSKAVDVANRTDDVQIRNIQNKAASNNAKDKLFSELTQVGAEIGRASAIAQEVRNNQELSQMSIKEGMAILKLKYPNFQLSEDLIEQLEAEGMTTGDLIKYIE